MVSVGQKLGVQGLAVHAGRTHSSVIANKSLVVVQLSVSVTKQHL